MADEAVDGLPAALGAGRAGGGGERGARGCPRRWTSCRGARRRGRAAGAAAATRRVPLPRRRAAGARWFRDFGARAVPDSGGSARAGRPRTGAGSGTSAGAAGGLAGGAGRPRGQAAAPRVVARRGARPGVDDAAPDLRRAVAAGADRRAYSNRAWPCPALLMLAGMVGGPLRGVGVPRSRRGDRPAGTGRRRNGGCGRRRPGAAGRRVLDPVAAELAALPRGAGAVRGG